MFAASGFARRLANMESLPEAARERAGIVVAELTRMEALLKQFLEFARPVGQAVPGRADADADADANRAVLAAVEAVRPEAEARGVGFALALAPGVAAVAFEPALLKQCVVNLLRNAMEAMAHGGVVRVSSGRDADRVRVRVADSGRGLTHDNLENMFSPFYKADHCEYGLGLAMVKKVVDDFGGAVEAAGQPGGGCAITLHLPPALAGGGHDAATSPGGAP
jgi:signal transduction histidine kinase